MNNRLDNLFKNRLQDHTIEPSPNSWTRVASGLSKKNNYGIWYSAAAAMVLIGFGVSFWIYSGGGIESADDIAQHDNSKNDINNLSSSTDSLERIAIPTPLIIERQKKNFAVTAKPSSKNRRAAEPQQDEVVLKPDEPIIELTSPFVAGIIEQESVLNKSTDIKSKPIVIVYELKPIHKKDLDPFELEQPQRKTGLKKVLEVANEMRTGDNPLGGLRQAKEEILAFNFRKEDKKIND